MTKHRLYTVLCQCVDNAIESILAQYSRKDICIVIGSCYPKDNLLLEYKDTDYFPKKLEVLLHNRPALKWLMRETDIEIDIDLFNEVFMQIFNDRFNAMPKKRSSMAIPHVIYVAHSRLDCYMLFKTIKWAYGSSNCRNVWKERFSSQRQNLVAVNDLISKYVHAKTRINRSRELKQYALEVKQYLDKVLCLQEM